MVTSRDNQSVVYRVSNGEIEAVIPGNYMDEYHAEDYSFQAVAVVDKKVHDETFSVMRERIAELLALAVEHRDLITELSQEIAALRAENDRLFDRAAHRLAVIKELQAKPAP
jgi:hypothetical protein